MYLCLSTCLLSDFLLSVILDAFSSADSCQHAGCERQMKGFLCRPVHVIHIICMTLGLVASEIAISREKVSVQPYIYTDSSFNLTKSKTYQTGSSV